MTGTVLVLAMHGSPPSDAPQEELAELMGLHMEKEHGSQGGEERAALEARHAELDERIRTWPRTPENDPFFAASMELAERLSEAAGCEVLVGFNEFCAPSLEEALERAAERGARKVVVVTPMMTRGGEHSERDIPAAVERAQKRRPEVRFVYAWPFDPAGVAGFLARHAASFA